MKNPSVEQGPKLGIRQAIEEKWLRHLRPPGSQAAASALGDCALALLLYQVLQDGSPCGRPRHTGASRCTAGDPPFARRSLPRVARPHGGFLRGTSVGDER